MFKKLLILCVVAGLMGACTRERDQAPVPPPGPPGAPAPVPAPVPSPEPALFAVQVVAANSPSQLSVVQDSLRKLGYRSYVVSEAGFFKVRIGPFNTRHEAKVVARNLRMHYGGNPFVVVQE